MRHPFPTVLCLGFALAVGLAGSVAPLAYAEVKVGDLRAVQAKDGIPLRQEPTALAKTLRTIPYGTKLKVLEVRDLWSRVSIDGMGEGWARSTSLVEPGTLTGKAAYAGAVTSADVTAAGRQFDQKTENTYRTMDQDIAKAYPLVDEVETIAPSELDVDTFIRAGVLGGTGEPGGSAGAKYAKLSLISTNGLKETDSSFDDLYVPQPRPMNDADFVQRLGMGFSPEQEYFLGRSVAAAAIAEFGLDPDPARQALVKRIGASIVRLADRVRGTYGGYHFAVLDTDVPNGVSGPGGFVLITRGALRLARNEDEVAGVIAHEIAHCVHKHGEQTIRKSRDFQDRLKALQERVTKPAEHANGECNICGDVARMLGGTAKSFVATLVKESYEKDFEFEADWDGSLFLCEVGYRASAIAEYLEMIPSREAATWTTHPSPEDRIEGLRAIVFKHGCPFDSDAGAQARLPRYRALGLVVPAAVPEGAPAAAPEGDRTPASATAK